MSASVRQPADPVMPQPLSPELLVQLRQVTVLASLSDEKMQCLAGSTRRHLEPDEVYVHQGETFRRFCLLLQGSVRVAFMTPSGQQNTMHVAERGSSFGEVPLLANMPSTATLTALEPCELLELDEDQFWTLMFQCPDVRKAILGNMAMRLARVQNATFQQEKMAALGTLAAGLMHELNNPGAAARRASSQLRENLVQLHELAARFTRRPMTQEQKECLIELQEYALAAKPDIARSTLEQADAEDALAEWMERAKIANAWKLAPTLVNIGVDPQTLECARNSFEADVFSDALAWLEALVSSMGLVTTIEESIGRVTDLVHAVKSYAYEGKGNAQTIDINQSIYATIVILAHKIREKGIVLEKKFTPNLPLLAGGCHGINQVWTNLLDNSIDAVKEGGRIRVRTWAEQVAGADDKRQELCILIGDDGPGIPLDCQTQIFDPFFTTKPVGVGTGLGLGIVHRIVEQCGGSIHFSSAPGSTEFVVRLPGKTDE